MHGKDDKTMFLKKINIKYAVWAWLMTLVMPCAAQGIAGTGSVDPDSCRVNGTCPCDPEPLRMHSTLYGGGFADMLDTYLSPYNYKGGGVRIIRQTERMTHLWHGHVSYQTQVDVAAQFTKSPARNVNAYSAGVRYTNAWLYNWDIRLKERAARKHRLKWEAGLGVSGYLGGMYNSRNGNNPAQAYADLMLDLTGQFHYGFKVKRREWLVRYQVNIPLMGCAFSPRYGQAYYEIFVAGNYDRNVVFANFVNMPSMRHLLTLDIPIRHNYLRIGWAGEFQQASFNGLRYHSYTNDFMIGFTKYFRRVKK